jgi:hypothetical protein
VPRTQLPEDLRRVFESRRGAQPSDIPVAQFLKEVGYEGPAEKAAAPRLSMQQRLASLTPNERETLETKTAEFPQQIEHTVKSYLSSIERKQSKLRTAARDKVRSAAS